MIKAIEEQKLSKSQSVKKICSRGAKIAAINDQLILALQHTGYDSVIIHARTNDLNESQPEDLIKGLTEMTEEARKCKWKDYAYKSDDESCLLLQGLVVYL